MKYFIPNRHKQKLAVVVERVKKPVGLVFVMHGLGGFKEQPFIRTVGAAFKARKFIVVKFDTANTIGESEGDYANANVTNYLSDLNDVIRWAKKQDWFIKPFCLAGHSLGSSCSLHYAASHPREVLAVIPASTTISGKMTLKRYNPIKLKEWEKTDWQVDESLSKPGVMKRLRWHQFKADSLKHDLLPKVKKIAMPILMIVGSRDTITPPQDQRFLFKKLPGKKELHVINGAPHTFRDKKHLDKIKKIIINWLDKVVL